MEAGSGRTAPLVPRTFLEAQAFCGALASSDLIPQKLKEKAADVLVLVLAGMEIGLMPLQSIRLHHVIEGIPRLSADGLAAIVLQSSECEYLEVSQSSEASCTWITKRRNRPEKSCTWTIDRAKRAGLTEKKNRDGSPGMWVKYPENMLSARARGELCRMVYPDIAAGLTTREEAMDGDFIDASYTETRSGGFVAPPATVSTNVVRVEGPPVGSPHIEITSTTRSKATSAPRPTPSQPSGNGSSAGGATTSSGQPTPSVGSGPAADSSPPSRLDAAVSKVEEKAVTKDRFGQSIAVDPTPADSSSAPSRSTESASAPTGNPPSGAASTPASAETAPTTSPAVVDEGGFGDDPVDSAPPTVADLAAQLAEFRGWLAGCKTHRDLQAGFPKWKGWCKTRVESGDDRFTKTGAGTEAMQVAYATRKSELPA